LSYLVFLTEWYNLVFLALAASGLLIAAVGRLQSRDRVGLAAGLVAAAVLGLTWNGAIHDLRLGSPAPRFPLVLTVAAAFGFVFGRWTARFRDRHLRPIRGVAFNRPGFEGTEAKIVTRHVGPEPGSGRAQWQDEEGTLHVVHVHTEVEHLPFGRRVRLSEFDADGRSYLAVPL
jgi:hypothetical protein